MIDLEAIAVRRADEQLDSLYTPKTAKRIYCRCGCGVWWYREKRTSGRYREFLNPQHQRRRRTLEAKARREYLTEEQAGVVFTSDGEILDLDTMERVEG